MPDRRVQCSTDSRQPSCQPVRVDASTPTAPLETSAGTPRFAACPLCHTSHGSLTADGLATGDDWRCVRCGQRWDAGRLQAVAAYADWVQERAPAVNASPPPTALPGLRS
jgi:PHP family Zn ribbon phosphoesterase